MDMTIDTTKYNTKDHAPGKEISCDDVDDNVIKALYLKGDKKDLKRMLWEAKHGDWVKQQEANAKLREQNKKSKKAQEVIMSQVSQMSHSDMQPSELANRQNDGGHIDSDELPHSDEEADKKKFATPGRRQQPNMIKKMKSGANTPSRPLGIEKKVIQTPDHVMG